MDRLAPLAPEVILVLAGIAVLLADAFSRARKTVLGYAGLLGFLSVIAAIIALEGKDTILFNGAYTVDSFSRYFKLLACVIGILAILMSLDSFPEGRSLAGELYGFLMIVTSGVMVMASATELVTFFIGLEIVSIPLYVLAAFGKYRPFSTEAGLKYFLNGAFASGVLVYGLSLLYGATGSTHFEALARFASTPDPWSGAFVLGSMLVLCALCFKVAAAPFHMWAPDVYQGAPTPVTAFISCAPKAAGIAMIIRLFDHTLGVMIPGEALPFIALFSMTVGNLAALRQTDIKRMMAYSGVAQIGYLFVGLSAGTESGVAAVIFYLLLYCVTNLAAFAVIVLAENLTGSSRIEDLAGMAARSPGVALVLLLALLSLAGIPPLSGFVGKFQLFAAAYQTGHFWLVLAAILNSVASKFYNLGVLRVAYFAPPSTHEPIPITGPQRLALVISTLGVVLLGLFPPLINWVGTVASTLMR
jgi:NADH-quinone oxidoreductase subunit N